MPGKDARPEKLVPTTSHSPERSILTGSLIFAAASAKSAEAHEITQMKTMDLEVIDLTKLLSIFLMPPCVSAKDQFAQTFFSNEDNITNCVNMASVNSSRRSFQEVAGNLSGLESACVAFQRYIAEYGPQFLASWRQTECNIVVVVESYDKYAAGALPVRHSHGAD